MHNDVDCETIILFVLLSYSLLTTATFFHRRIVHLNIMKRIFAYGVKGQIFNPPIIVRYKKCAVYYFFTKNLID